eukprot:COSAG01_NODE_45283_length_410_cov_5.501608_1_plen_99_part_01
MLLLPGCWRVGCLLGPAAAVRLPACCCCCLAACAAAAAGRGIHWGERAPSSLLCASSTLLLLFTLVMMDSGGYELACTQVSAGESGQPVVAEGERHEDA